ncbi:MAG: tagaturonate epimerase family protein [Bacteroidota bacterium]
MKPNIVNAVIQIRAKGGPDNPMQALQISDDVAIKVYPNSVSKADDLTVFVGMEGMRKNLYLAGADGEATLFGEFDGKNVLVDQLGGVLKRCPMNHVNANRIRQHLGFTRPTLLGLDNSIGCGDRLGLANAGHLRAIANSGWKPILAQQSVRELERTKREAEDVMDAATWAVLQEGFQDGYGADADHLKTPEDIDRYARAGFTMFTLDIGAYVVNEAARMPMEQVTAKFAELPWKGLNDTPAAFLDRYAGKRFQFEGGLEITPTKEEALRGGVKYGAGIAQTLMLATYLESAWGKLPHEIELSVDETDSPTSPIEHLIIANELKRLGVKLVSLAPRFLGDFEKGIEYKGDLTVFKNDYLKHVRIAKKLGPYKISIHSGSDKFDIYRAIGSLAAGPVHVKTAGTSWLEALRTVVASDPGLFREILDCARANYDNDRKSYHVTADVARLKATSAYRDGELLQLLSDDNARQILHVTFGTILSKKGSGDTYQFKERILDCLKNHEEIHYGYLRTHFRRHLDPLSSLVNPSKKSGSSHRVTEVIA